MTKFSVCIDAVFQNRNIAETFHSLNSIGINSVEFWSWWDKDLELLYELTKDHNINIVCFCTKFVSLTDSNFHEEYLDGLRESIDAAKRLNCKMLITQTGNELDSISRSEQNSNIIDGLKKCKKYLEESDITLLIEPLNTIYDHIGYYLWSSKECVSIIHELESNSIKMLYDIYHQQIMEGDILNTIISNLDVIGHIHCAGHPGRNELNLGEINYSYVFNNLVNAGYNKHFGLEYFPKNKPESFLNELYHQYN